MVFNFATILGSTSIKWIGTALTFGSGIFFTYKHFKKKHHDTTYLENHEKDAEELLKKETRQIEHEDIKVIPFEEEDKANILKELTLLKQKLMLIVENVRLGKILAGFPVSRFIRKTKIEGVAERKALITAISNTQHLGNIIYAQLDELSSLLKGQKPELDIMRQMVLNEKFSKEEIKQIRQYKKWYETELNRQAGNKSAFKKAMYNEQLTEKGLQKTEKTEIRNERSAYDEQEESRKLLKEYYNNLVTQGRNIRSQIKLLKTLMSKKPTSAKMSDYLKAGENIQRKMEREKVILHDFQQKKDEITNLLIIIKNEEAGELKTEGRKNKGFKNKLVPSFA